MLVNRNALVIGATGLLGYGVTVELFKSGWHVRAMGRRQLIKPHFFPDGVEYIYGDFFDTTFLEDSLKDIDKVFFFLSSTFPSSSTESLELEISRTLHGLDYLLSKMKTCGTNEIVFPSSGGTVYGDIEHSYAKETDLLKPTTPYGVGKVMCEDILRFYSQFGISSTILRIGNVYGSPLLRTTAQGVIDIFIQRALLGETITIWGDSLYNIRDYIFLDDFSRAVALIAEYKPEGIDTYNLSSGIGTTLEEIINSINKHVEEPLKIEFVENNISSSIRRIVLDIQKFKIKTKWEAKYDIDSGIIETIYRKKHLI